jgi:UDPglucose 6-dehydrogenase
MKVLVIGLGYVGLSNAVLLAQHNEVIGIDVSDERVKNVNDRICPLDDHLLKEYFEKKDLNLKASKNFAEFIPTADFIIISTPTNYDVNTQYFDTSSIDSLIKQIIDIKPESNIVIKSTIPVTYVNKIRKKFKTNAVMFSPEFLREGSALYDNLYPSRIVVGETSKRAEAFANLLKQGASKNDVEVILTDPCEAEAIKLFSNSYLAMRVAFFNELDTYALENGIHCEQIVRGICSDPRIGHIYNNPSFGYGGYCLPKDTKQLLSNYSSIPQDLFTAIVKSNETRKKFITSKILSQKPKTVGIFRLVMKADSDNFRESAVCDIIENLTSQGINVVVYEPNCDDNQIMGADVQKNLNLFKEISDVIISNRYENTLEDVKQKVFTRDLFNRD